jgi:hypothetical protein
MSPSNVASGMYSDYIVICTGWFPPKSINGWGRVNYRACELAIMAVDQAQRLLESVQIHSEEVIKENREKYKFWNEVRRHLIKEQKKHYEYRNSE